MEKKKKKKKKKKRRVFSTPHSRVSEWLQIFTYNSIVADVLIKFSSATLARYVCTVGWFVP